MRICWYGMLSMKLPVQELWLPLTAWRCTVNKFKSAILVCFAWPFLQNQSTGDNNYLYYYDDDDDDDLLSYLLLERLWKNLYVCSFTLISGNLGDNLVCFSLAVLRGLSQSVMDKTVASSWIPFLAQHVLISYVFPWVLL